MNRKEGVELKNESIINKYNMSIISFIWNITNLMFRDDITLIY